MCFHTHTLKGTDRRASWKFIKARKARTSTESKFLAFNILRVGYQERNQDQEEIKVFIEDVFGDKQKIDLNEFKRINIEDSSEMLFAVRSLLLTFTDHVYFARKPPLCAKFLQVEKQFQEKAEPDS